MTTHPILQVKQLEVTLGDESVVRGADLTVVTGLTALVGESGCGKTTLLRSIAGFERPCGGSIRLQGEVVADGRVHVPPERRNVGMVFQEGALFPHLSVWDNVRYGVRGSEGEARAREMLDLVGLVDLAGRFPDELSGGQQQRVALARALAPEPRLVLLDEPFASLDATLRERVRQEVREILERAEATAILVTHDQEEALSIADRVAVMIDGVIAQVGVPEEVYRRPASPAVARFMGGADLLPCNVLAGRCASALGSVPCHGIEGAGLLLVRPEDLVMAAGAGGEGVRGRVVRRRFYGHDALDTVELDDGTTLEVRVLAGDTLPEGSKVSIRLREGEPYVLSRSLSAVPDEP